MTLKDKIKEIPKTPGIYLMKDKDNNIIYVGKSKKLQERVKSYFVNSSNHSRKIQRMVKSIADIEIITTDTELDALLLECEYIKNIKPMYNTLLKNHEAYSYLKIDMKEKYPYLEVVSEVNDECEYFGPYSKVSKLEKIKDILNDSYKLRSCKRMSKCFKYDLSQCLGPCREVITEKDYNKRILDLTSDLKGETNHIIENLKENMKVEINNLNFEKAAMIKENIDVIERLFNKQEVINNSENNNLSLIWVELDEDTFKVYVIKNGRVLKTEKINKSIYNTMDKKEYLNKICKDTISTDDKVEKYDVDFINIIYNYIKYDKSIVGKIERCFC